MLVVSGSPGAGPSSVAGWSSPMWRGGGEAEPVCGRDRGRPRRPATGQPSARDEPSISQSEIEGSSLGGWTAGLTMSPAAVPARYGACSVVVVTIAVGAALAYAVAAVLQQRGARQTDAALAL